MIAVNAVITRIIEPKTQIEDHRKRFSNSDLKRLIIPLFWEQLLVMLVGIVDTLMVSYAGEAAVSGVSLVNMFNIVFINLFTALASGGAVVVSQYIGNKDRSNGNTSASQLVMFSLLFSALVMGIVLLFNRSLLGLLFGRVEPDVMEACVTYLRISAYSYPAIALYSAGAALYRSMGQTRTTMVISIASNGINVVGNAIGIFVLRAGVSGVAYPSLIARVFSAAVIVILCFQKKNAVSLQWKKILAWNWEAIGRILRIALPNGIESGLFQLAKVALSSITALFGTAQIAANGVAQSFWSMAALIGVAMSPAFITVIGQCMGAGDVEAADYYMKKLLRITVSASIVWNLLIFVAVFPAMGFYALSEETVRLVIILVAIHNLFNAAFFPFAGPLPNGFRAAGDVKFPMYTAIFTTVICRVIFSVIFAIWMNLGVIGIAWAMCADWVIKSILMIVHYRRGKWKGHRVI
ncbi:MATE family efflux transporter [Ruminococcaceae bacterium OttesenSCG-928-L11]|nr:MATE family efflux transporter [Ruminococcaceae bacterium OttesenSCG-928-L11]